MRYAAILFAFILLFATACQNASSGSLKVAASSVPHAEILEQVKPLLKQEGIDLEIVVIDDYHLPNRALAEREVDANYFQHLPFLDMQKKELGYAIVPLAKVHLEPMGLYSAKTTSLNLPEKSTVLIPNDPTNQARALLLLEKAGLITLKKKDLSITALDIKDNPLNLQILDVDAALLPRSLEDAHLAAIPANFALQAKLSPPLFQEEHDSLFVNILAVREEDQEHADLLQLKEALLSNTIKSFIEKKYQGSVTIPY